MTLDEAFEEKKHCEQKIADLLREFQWKTKLNVDGVDLAYVDVTNMESTRTEYKIRSVDLSVSL